MLPVKFAGFGSSLKRIIVLIDPLEHVKRYEQIRHTKSMNRVSEATAKLRLIQEALKVSLELEEVHRRSHKTVLDEQWPIGNLGQLVFGLQLDLSEIVRQVNGQQREIPLQLAPW